MHLFCTYMDDKMAMVDPSRQEKPFTSRHYASSPTKPSTLVSSLLLVVLLTNLGSGGVLIYLTNPYFTPHFNLYVKGELIELQRV